MKILRKSVSKIFMENTFMLQNRSSNDRPSNDFKFLRCRIPTEVYKMLKISCFQRDISMQQMIEELVNQKVENDIRTKKK